MKLEKIKIKNKHKTVKVFYIPNFPTLKECLWYVKENIPLGMDEGFDITDLVKSYEQKNRFQKNRNIK